MQKYNESVFNTLNAEEQKDVIEIVRKILNRYKGQIVELFSKDKSLDEIIETNLFEVMREIQRADTWYWILENKK